MVVRKTCAYRFEDGRPCGAAPLRDSVFCLWHSPEHAEQVAESRRLGGLRRRREVALSGAYELQSVITVRDIQRLIEIAVMDTLSLENGVTRNRTLAYLAQTALRSLDRRAGGADQDARSSAPQPDGAPGVRLRG